MSNIAITISADDRELLAALKSSSSHIKQFADSGGRAMDSLSTSTGQAEDAMMRMATAMRTAFIGGGMAATIITLKNAVVGMTTAMADAQMQADKMRNTLDFALGEGKAGQEIAYIKKVTQELGVSFQAIGPMYTRFAASTKGTVLEGQKTRDVFESIAKTSLVMGMSTEETEGAMRALTQMVSKGTIQAEELRGQFGERVPGAFKLFADSMGVSTAQLSKMLELGQVAPERLAEFQKFLTNAVGPQVAKATETLQANINRLANEWLFLKQAFAEAGAANEASAFVKDLTRFLTVLEEVMKGAKKAGQGFFETMANAAGAAVGLSFFGTLNGLTNLSAMAFNKLTFGLTKFDENVRVMPRNLRPLSEQISLMGDDIQQAHAKLIRLRELDAMPMNGDYYKAQITQLEAYIAKLQAAQFEKAKLAGVQIAGAGRGSVNPQTVGEMETEAKNRAIKQKEAFDKAMEQYATPNEKLNAELQKQRNLMGDLFTPDIERRIREHFIKPINLAENGLKLYGDLVAKEVQLAPNFAEQWDSLSAAYRLRKITLDQLTEAQAKLLAQQPFMVKAKQEEEKLLKRIQDEQSKTLDAAWKAADATAQQAEQQARANATFGMGKSAIAELTLAELENQMASLQATEHVIPGYIEALEARIKAQRRLVREMKEGEALDANEKAAKEAAAEWRRTAESIERSITDALMRGFESGKDFGQNLKDSLINMFRTLILRPVVQAVVTGTLGLGSTSASANGVGQISGAMGVMDTISKVYSTITSGFAALGDKVAFAVEDIGAWLVNNTTGVLNQAGSSLMSSAGALGTAASYAGGALAGYGIGTAISGQYAAFGNKNIATVTGTAIGAVIAGPIGAAIGGAIGGLVNRAFGMGAKETRDYGLTGQFSATGANLSQYSNWYQEGGWFRSDRSGTDYAAINSELGKFLNSAVGMTTSATKAYASAIGLSADAVNGFSKSINISLKDLDDAAKEKAIAAAITGFGDAMAQTAYGATLAMFAKDGETASVTLGRLGNSLMAVNKVLDTLNQGLLATSIMGADAASKLLDLVGGTDAFAALTTAYYQSIYTEEERLAKTREQLAKAFSEVFGGASVPQTLQAYKALVDAQDLTTEVGRQQYAVLLQLAPAFGEVTKAAMATADAAYKEAEAKVAALRASGKSISEWLTALKISTGSPSVSMSAARTQYLQTLNLARANDQSALGSITGMADQYIAAAKGQATSSAQFAAIVAQVGAEVSGLPAVKGYQQETMDMLASIRETIGLVGESVSAEVYTLARTTVKEFARLDSNVDGLLTFDELAKGLKGIATDEQISKLISTVDLNGDGQLSALELVNAAVDTVGSYSSGTMDNTADALKASAKQIEALVFMNNDGLMAVSKNTAATLDYLAPMRDYLRNIDASTAKTAANPVVVNQSSGGGGLIGKVLRFFGFASGGVFGGQGIYNTPTPFMFDGGQLGVMGEAGPEAVMPLERMADGALGVRALPSYIYTQQGGPDQTVYMAALVSEVSALRSEVTDLRAEARATAVNTGKSQRLLERVTQNGDAMQTVAVV
jgi:tape measure domain-containing protein|nr:MAG TPA_asm: Tail tape measure [Bacteriophage sp.]